MTSNRDNLPISHQGIKKKNYTVLYLYIHDVRVVYHNSTVRHHTLSGTYVSLTTCITQYILAKHSRQSSTKKAQQQQQQQLLANRTNAPLLTRQHPLSPLRFPPPAAGGWTGRARFPLSPCRRGTRTAATLR